MDLNLEHQRVVITGGSRGIGLACASSFLEEGCRVTIVGSRAETLQAAKTSLASRYADRVATTCADLGSAAGVQALGPLLDEADIVVNNAGAIPGGGLDGVSDEAWRHAWDLKVHGYVEVTRRALPAMIRRGRGVILNVIGIFGVQPRFDYLCGSVGNAALVAFTKAVGGHASRHGVRVLGINPGATRTDRLEKLYRSRAAERLGDENRWQELLDDLPFNRLAEPSEVADLAVFLASPRAAYLSGLVVDADGGQQYAGR